MKEKKTFQRAAGLILILLGAAIATNAFVSGPHAFSGGLKAIVAMAVAGIACVGAGIIEVLRARKPRTEA